MILMRKLLCAILCLCLCFATAAPAFAAAYAYDYEDYTDLIGAMEIVNCASYASLRAYPDTSSQSLARVPLGSIVYNCWYQDEKFTYCEFDGMQGYILNSNLSFISGPVGQEYTDDMYLGNYRIVNCKSYASLRDYPDTKGNLITRVPLGSIVTNVYYENERFCYCMFGDAEGFILSDNLEWVSGGSNQDYIGDCVIVNCASYASLREKPDTSSKRLARVPLGAKVTNCYIVDDRFAMATYDGMTGYILLDNLGW